MSRTAKSLSFAEFTGGALDSLSWYDLGWGETVAISDVPSLPTELERDLSELGRQCFLGQAQVLSAELLTGRVSMDLETLHRLAFQASKVMSRELRKGGDRQLRMWAQRLNYALQPLICLEEPEADLTGLLSETTLEGNKPWDALFTNDEKIWITSDPLNVHLRGDGMAADMSLGLPTQIDRLQDGAISLGSLYSSGATILGADRSPGPVAHDKPVLMVFDWTGTRFLADTDGCICEVATGDVVHEAPCRQVHFARYFDGRVYLLNNGDFGHITCLDMASGQVTRQPVLPVQVCNDIAITDSTAYLIDKQQGSVFAFDRDWTYRGRRLSFGTGKGQLADPVSLRLTERGMACVSWLSHKRTEIALF